MITIPESIKVTRSHTEESFLCDKTKRWLESESESRGTGIHATDLLDPRKAFWNKTKPLPLTDRMVSIFTVGRVLHAIVLGAVDGVPDLGVTDAGGRTSEELGITYSPDRVHSGRVYEFKTARNFKEPTDTSDLSHYIEQLLVYMAATNTTDSTLWVLYLNLKDEAGRTSPAFRAYTVGISSDDLAKVKTELRETRDKLYDAIERNDPSDLPLCREWLCSARMCEYWEDCKPTGRYEVSGAEEASVKRLGKARAVQPKPKHGSKGIQET